MMNDTVREELASKVSPSANLPKRETIQETSRPPKPVIMEARPPAAPVAKRVLTANLTSPKTSPTLVEFQNKNTSIPEWRLQMQNAVRQRKGITSDDGGSVNAVSSSQTQHVTHGANALKTEIVEQSENVPPIENADPRLSAALKRLDESRRTFLPDEKNAAAAPKPSAAKNFPFNIVAPTPNPPVRPPRPIESGVVRPNPSMVTPLRMEKKLDTNRLPRIDTIISEPAVEITAAPNIAEVEVSLIPASDQMEFSNVRRIVINAESDESDVDEIDEPDGDEIEDLAPFSMRFGAGLFDLIIGVAASMIILSPFAFIGGEWFSWAGIITFLSTVAMVLFVYMTMSIGFYGKTWGMRIFELELVVADGDGYPTLRQASVSSSIFILSLLFGGLGFVPVFFNEEKRAAHDLLSGTIIVRVF